MEQLNVLLPKLEGTAEERDSALKDLRVLIAGWRKQCINNTQAQDELRESGAATAVVSLLTKLTAKPDASSSSESAVVPLLKVGVTFLSNWITMNEKNQSFLWKEHFPEWFSKFLYFTIARQERELLSFYSMLLYNSSCNSASRRELLATNGVDIIRNLLDASVVGGKAAEDDAFDWIYLIIKSLYEYIPQFFSKLYFGEELERVHSQEQLTLISLLDISVEKGDLSSEVLSRICPFLATEVDQSVSFVITKERNNIPIYGIGLNRIQMIGTLLNTLSAIAQAHNHQLNKLLTNHGIVQSLISLLSHCQEKTIAEATARATAMATATTTSTTTTTTTTMTTAITTATTTAMTTANTELTNAKSALRGLKSDSIRVLANLAFDDIECQTSVRELGGLALILSNCIFDDDNNYLREWSILALRNLCLENVENQQFVASLKALAVPPKVQEEMHKQGFRVEISEDGKVKLVKEIKPEKPPKDEDFFM